MRPSDVGDKTGAQWRFLRARCAPRQPYGRQFTLGLLVLALATWTFAIIAQEVFMPTPLAARDQAIAQWFQLHRHPALTQAMLFITRLHSNLGVAVLTLLTGFLFYQRGYRFWLYAMISGVFGGMLLNAGLKSLFQRPRPVLDPILSLATYSFPSGHTMNATVFYAVLAAFVVMRRRTALGLGALTLAVIMIILVAVSRLYLGVHFFSDVLASVAEGIAWLAVCLTALNTYTLSRNTP